MQESTQKDYREFRDQIVSFIQRDIEGPYSEDEVIDELPSSKYSLGILFPQLDPNVDPEVAGDIGIISKSDDGDDVSVVEQSSAFYPSAAGLSFSVKNNVKKVNIGLSFGKYVKITSKDFEKVHTRVPGLGSAIKENTTLNEYFDYSDSILRLKRPMEKHDYAILKSMAGEKNNLIYAINRIYYTYMSGWYRLQYSEQLEIELDQKIIDRHIQGTHLSIKMVCKDIPNSDKKIATCSIINNEKSSRPQTSVGKSVYQIKMYISLLNKHYFQEMGEANNINDLIGDIEDRSLSLLYRNQKVYSVGHGISAEWLKDDNGNVSQLYTQTIPSHVLPQMNFNIKPSDGANVDLKMRKFAFDDESNVFNSLTALIEQYEAWINNLKSESNTLNDQFKKVAHMHLERCMDSSMRMRSGIELLKSDKNSMEAFRRMNEAMTMQRVHTRIQNDKSLSFENKTMPKDYTGARDEWRPFQIAFILINLRAISDPESEDRDVVDLIWFPTGGGKTEAYLGLTAFTIFIRRIQNPNNYGGTSVIMRYTLRLLTSQQFQRASTLICACEKIRRNNVLFGSEPITVGLWVGGSLTPNDLNGASKKIAIINSSAAQSGNPFQVITCPWCGAYITKHDGAGVNCYQIKHNPKKRLMMWCPNPACDFSAELNGLPIKVVDEDIYNSPPSLLFGTVDKFAMLPWREGAASIFALNKDNDNLSPSLIIQDELHLISGSLGTMVGLYETAIDILSSKKGIKPKIIASTATIRRAQEQCRALYARRVNQFPSPGIDASDSFFARESDVNDETPGRLYIGIMPSGKTATSLQVHLTANVIQSVKYIEGPDDVKNAYWTQVIYCNSIRELGSTKTVVYDDVQNRSGVVMKRLGSQQRYYTDSNITELTSRVDSNKIPEILKQLSVDYPSKGVVDVLLATNMISVGVDIDRLGLMVVLGQPKTTAEYIQASSRVGRKYPGIVITQLSPTKSRDRSHYEQFVKYHQSLYRYVEPTSVTPFSPPARTKALHALLFTLIRHSVGLSGNDDLGDFINKKTEIQGAIDQIIHRVTSVDPSEANQTRIELDAIINRMTEISQNSEGISYKYVKNSTKIPIMKASDDMESKAYYPTPQSMRNTDAECYITLNYS